MYISELFHGGPEQTTTAPTQNALVAEANQAQLVVLYPGRFQPFHLGHADVFRSLQSKFGRNSVFIATSNVTDSKKSPFNFTDKTTIMHAAGVPADRVLEVQSPYKLPPQFDPTSTIFVVAVGAPDADRLRPDSTKKDGNAGYYKTFKSLGECETADKHGYVIIAEERHFAIKLNGQEVDVSHGTPSRQAWNMVRNDPKGRAEYMTQMFGRADPELGRILDKIPAPVGESLEEGIFDRFKKKPVAEPVNELITPEERAFITKHIPHNNASLTMNGQPASDYVLPKNVTAYTGKARINFYKRNGQLQANVGYYRSSSDAQNLRVSPIKIFDEPISSDADMQKLKTIVEESNNMKNPQGPKAINPEELDSLVTSVGQKAKQGPMKTVWVPAKHGAGGAYKVVPAGEAPIEEDGAPMSREEYNQRRKALQQIQMDPELTRDPTLRKELIKKIAQLTMQARSAGVLPESVHALHVQENKLFEAKAIINTVKHLKENAKQLNEESPLSAVGFSDAFINKVYRGYNIKHTELPEPMTKKPTVADLDGYVFLSKTNTGKAFAVGKGDRNWAGAPIGYVTIDNGDGTIKELNMPPSKAIAQVAKGEYYAIPYQRHAGGRIRGQVSTAFKRANLDDPRVNRSLKRDPQEVASNFMQKVEKLYGDKIRAEMNNTVDFVYANMRKFGSARNSNISGTSPQEQVLKIANALDAAAKDKNLFSSRSGNWDRPNFIEQYLRSLSSLHSGFASIPSNYNTFMKTMDDTPAGLAKFAKFILSTVRAYESQVKELLN